jgi:hypothetical protein
MTADLRHPRAVPVDLPGKRSDKRMKPLNQLTFMKTSKTLIKKSFGRDAAAAPFVFTGALPRALILMTGLLLIGAFGKAGYQTDLRAEVCISIPNYLGCSWGWGVWCSGSPGNCVVQLDACEQRTITADPETNDCGRRCAGVYYETYQRAVELQWQARSMTGLDGEAECGPNCEASCVNWTPVEDDNYQVPWCVFDTYGCNPNPYE